MKIDPQNTFLRRAEISDALITYKWAMDPAVRNNSINPEPFSFESHISWFEKKILSNNTHYFILMERYPLGQIRFDSFNDGWLISFLIDETFRANGLGKAIIEKGITLVGKGIYYAYVKTHNLPSKKIFERLLFQEISSDIPDTYLYRLILP